MAVATVRRRRREVIHDTKAFLTGSHVYGAPNDDSDVDVVIFCSKETAKRIQKLLGNQGPSNYDGTVRTVKSGNLQLIMCDNARDMESWRCGTKTLSHVAPVTKEQAEKAMTEIRGLMHAR